MSQYTFVEAEIPAITAPTRDKQPNPFTAQVQALAANRDKAGAFFLTYDKAKPETASIDPTVNKELAKVQRDLNAAGRDNKDDKGNPAPVTVRKRVELIVDGKVTKGVRVTVWAIDPQKRERKTKVETPAAPAETPTETPAE